MSTFITAADYNTTINAEIIDRLIEGDTAIQDNAENSAIEFMRSHLCARFDVDAIFAATAGARNPLLVKYAVDIALHYMYSRLQPNQIPELRVMNYEAAATYLRRVQKEELTPTGMPLVADGVKDYIQYGSNPKRTNHVS